MKKLATVCLLCAALLLAACGAARPAASVAPVQTPAAAEAPAPPSPFPVSTPEPVPDAELTALLQEIRDRMHIGTAGSSLKAAGLAVDALNWGRESRLDLDAICFTLDAWLDTLDPDAQEEFFQQLESVDHSFQLLTVPGEEAEMLLSDAGCEDMGYPWNEQAVAAVENLMLAAGLR